MSSAAVDLKNMLTTPHFLIGAKHHVFCRSTSQGYTLITLLKFFSTRIVTLKIA